MGGNKDGILTSLEIDILRLHKSLIDIYAYKVKPENDVEWNGYYMLSSSGLQDNELISKGDVKWFIKCTENSANCFKDAPYTLIKKGKVCKAENVLLVEGSDTEVTPQLVANLCAAINLESTLPPSERCRYCGLEYDYPRKRIKGIQEKTTSEKCPEGLIDGDEDYYEMREE